MSLRQDASGRALLMPSIRSTYDENFNLPKVQMSSTLPALSTVLQPLSYTPSLPFAAATGPTQLLTVREQSPRLQDIEGRLAAQEHRTASLLDRALRVKHDVVDAIGVAQGTWQQERQARELLQEHIRSITAVVNQLHHDVASLASQLQGRDAAIHQTGQAAKSMEFHYQSAINDLKNRVARGDASIAKLASDIAGLNDLLKHQGHGQLNSSHRVADHVNALESRVAQLSGQLDRMASESAIKLRFAEGDSVKVMAMVDARLKGLSDELRNALGSAQLVNATEREKMEGRIMAFMERSNMMRDGQMEKLERTCLDIVNAHGDRIGKLEGEVRYLHDTLARLEALLLALQATAKPVVQPVESNTSNSVNVNQRSLVPADFERYFVELLERGLCKLRHDLEKLKREVREGFMTVHDTISNMNKMIEAKRCLLEEQLRKELSHLRKMVVLI